MIVLLVVLALAGVALIVLWFQLRITQANVTKTASQQAMQMLETWRARDMQSIRDQQLQVARAEIGVQFESWKAEFEHTIRQDAIRKSESVTLGKVTEHFVPYLPDFTLNPKDARFVGTPIDFIVFDGLSEGDVRSIVFIEVKTGKGQLSTRERRVRDAIEAGRVSWMELRPTFDTTTATIVDALRPAHKDSHVRAS